ncbi:MAG TPA: DUF6763 family protein [Gammaproteobacteria bacterium]|jgi:hypothetical protein
MAAEDDGARPAVGDWYMDLHSRERFKILGIEDGEIQVQYYDGDIDSFDAADWQNRLFTRTDGPEDFTGALEPIEDGDAGYDEESYDASQSQLPDVEDGNVLLPGEGAARPYPAPGRRGH